MEWISVKKRMPEDDTPVTWKYEDGITIYTDINHDMGFEDVERFLKGKVPIIEWLDETKEPEVFTRDTEYTILAEAKGFLQGLLDTGYIHGRGDLVVRNARYLIESINVVLSSRVSKTE